jgi:hypothetical protein
MTFTKELIRRSRMTSEDVTREIDNFRIEKHKSLDTEIEKVFHKYLKNGVPTEVITQQTRQTVEWFQEYMELGGFCRPGEDIRMTNDGKNPLHSDRVSKRDLLFATETFEKALSTVRKLSLDPGAWEEFQRKLLERDVLNDIKNSRRDLFVLQILSGLEMISESIDDMLKEGTLFKRNKSLIQKARRATVTRLAFLFEWSKSPDRTPNTVSALQHVLDTMTKADDWGEGKESFGNAFVKFIKDVFKALGMTDTDEFQELSGTTIRSDILVAVKELEIKKEPIIK